MITKGLYGISVLGLLGSLFMFHTAKTVRATPIKDSSAKSIRGAGYPGCVGTGSCANDVACSTTNGVPGSFRIVAIYHQTGAFNLPLLCSITYLYTDSQCQDYNTDTTKSVYFCSQ